MEGEKGEEENDDESDDEANNYYNIVLGGVGGVRGCLKSIVKWSFILLLIIWVIDSNCVLFIL